MESKVEFLVKVKDVVQTVAAVVFFSLLSSVVISNWSVARRSADKLLFEESIHPQVKIDQFATGDCWMVHTRSSQILGVFRACDSSKYETVTCGDPVNYASCVSVSALTPLKPKPAAPVAPAPVAPTSPSASPPAAAKS